MTMALAVPMQEPICLVENRKEKLTVNKKALKILTSITKPVVVVAIVGVCRSGKSYLMNRLAGKNRGFPLGATIQSHTKGIWMWCIDHPRKPDHVLVLLDTEGLGDVEKGDSQNDSWIFALAILLSSTFVYNSMGTINYQGLEQMHYVTELTELIKVRSSSDAVGEESEEFVGCFPDFVWTVRDFILELELDGCPITQDDYLEKALKLTEGKSPRVKMVNLPRQCIKNFFPTRKCFIFDRPTNNISLLAHLEAIHESQLLSTFKEQSDNFCSYIFSNAKPKSLNGGITVNGNRLGELLKIYVNTISSGDIPCLENAVLALAQTENSAAVQRATNHYVELMSQKVNLHLETLQELLNLHKNCEKEAISVFMKHSFKDDSQKFQMELRKILETKKNDFIHQYEEQSTQYYETELEKLSQTLMEAVDQASFLVPGGYKLYREEREKMINRYHKLPRKGMKAKEVLQRFLQSLAKKEAFILVTDQALTYRDKALEAERIKREASDRLLEQQQKKMQQMMEAQKRSYEEIIQLKKELEQEILDHEKKERREWDQRLCLGGNTIPMVIREKVSKMKRYTENIQRKIVPDVNLLCVQIATILFCVLICPGKTLLNTINKFIF